MILDCAYHDKELGLHSLCNHIADDAICSHLLLPLLIGELLGMLWVVFQVDIEMRGLTIGIVIVDHLAMDMHQTARWAMLMDHAVDGHEAGRQLLQSAAMLQIELSRI